MPRAAGLYALRIPLPLAVANLPAESFGVQDAMIRRTPSRMVAASHFRKAEQRVYRSKLYA